MAKQSGNVLLTQFNDNLRQSTELQM